MTRAEPQHIQTLFKRAVKYRWAAEEQAGSGHFPTAASVVEPTGALLGLSRVLLRYPRVSSAQSPSSWAQHLLTGQLERLTQNRLVWVCAFAYTRPPPPGYTRTVCVRVCQRGVFSAHPNGVAGTEYTGGPENEQCCLVSQHGQTELGVHTGTAEVWDKEEKWNKEEESEKRVGEKMLELWGRSRAIQRDEGRTSH